MNNQRTPVEPTPDFLSEIAPLLEASEQEPAADFTAAPHSADNTPLTSAALKEWARRLACLYGRHGVPLRQIADLIGRSHSTVQRWQKEANITASPRPQQLSVSVTDLNIDAARLRAAAATAASDPGRNHAFTKGDHTHGPRITALESARSGSDIQLQEHEDAIAQLRQQNKALLAAIAAIRQHLGI